MEFKTKYDWSDITLSQIQEINSLPKFDNKLDGMIEQLSILTDNDPYDIRKLPVDDMIKEFNKWDFINETPKGKEIKTIKVNKIKYGLIEFNKMSLAQLVDIEEYASEGIMDNAHKILSVLYLPYKNLFSKKLKEYEPNMDFADSLKSITLDKLYPTLVFFYHIVQVYLNNSQQSLENQLKQMETEMTKEERKQLGTVKRKLKNVLKENGIG